MTAGGGGLGGALLARLAGHLCRWYWLSQP